MPRETVRHPIAPAFAFAVSLMLLSGAVPARRASAALPGAEPAAVKLDPARLAEVGDAARRAVEQGKVPGAVVLVGRAGKVAYDAAFGRRAVEPSSEPMTRDTIFDLASLTKPVATATAVMILVERGKVGLADPIARHLPELDNHGKGQITVEQLLRHRSGLIADNPIGDYADGPAKAWERLANLDLKGKPGAGFLYSDVNFLILGKLVERVSGQKLDAFVAEHVIRPLGVSDTGYRPLATPPEALPPASRIAPTESDEDGTMLRGVVHDPRARRWGAWPGTRACSARPTTWRSSRRWSSTRAGRPGGGSSPRGRSAR